MQVGALPHRVPRELRILPGPTSLAAAAKAAKAANPAAVAQHATALAQAPVRVPS